MEGKKMERSFCMFFKLKMREDAKWKMNTRKVQALVDEVDRRIEYKVQGDKNTEMHYLIYLISR